MPNKELRMSKCAWLPRPCHFMIRHSLLDILRFAVPCKQPVNVTPHPTLSHKGRGNNGLTAGRPYFFIFSISALAGAACGTSGWFSRTFLANS